MKSFLLILFLLVTHSALGFDPPWTNGETLLEATNIAIKSADNVPLSPQEILIYCDLQGYLFGFIDATNLGVAYRSNCPYSLPQKCSALMLARVLNRYLLNHPEKLSEDETVLVMEALKDAFPNPAFR
jgi:hypothetical protein